MREHIQTIVDIFACLRKNIFVQNKPHIVYRYGFEIANFVPEIPVVPIACKYIIDAALGVHCAVLYDDVAVEEATVVGAECDEPVEPGSLFRIGDNIFHKQHAAAANGYMSAYLAVLYRQIVHAHVRVDTGQFATLYIQIFAKIRAHYSPIINVGRRDVVGLYAVKIHHIVASRQHGVVCTHSCSIRVFVCFVRRQNTVFKTHIARIFGAEKSAVRRALFSFVRHIVFDIFDGCVGSFDLYSAILVVNSEGRRWQLW